MHQGRPTLSRTSGPWASGIILHICQVSTKYLSSICQVCIKYLSSNSQVSFCAFVKANPDNPSFSLILELMELENIVANTVYLKVIFLSSIRYIRCILPSCHIVIANLSNTVYLVPQSCISTVRCSIPHPSRKYPIQLNRILSRPLIAYGATSVFDMLFSEKKLSCL